uniref:N-alpha-acetyltransferase 40 n=1 Tax=Monodelphis domestica TaxID=13616 RepID=A0A5F8GG26_MONDO
MSRMTLVKGRDMVGLRFWGGIRSEENSPISPTGKLRLADQGLRRLGFGVGTEAVVAMAIDAGGQEGLEEGLARDVTERAPPPPLAPLNLIGARPPVAVVRRRGLGTARGEGAGAAHARCGPRRCLVPPPLPPLPPPPFRRRVCEGGAGAGAGAAATAATMGRKSSKAKEKKQKRLEERAAMDAVCAKVEAANKLEDPLEAFPVFKKYDRNGLNVSIECKRVSGLEQATVDWAFDLTKSNMQTLYEQSEWGWKDREKKEEMTDDRAWYLIAWEESAVPVAFSHFRFDVECGDEVLYCYEVQLESKVRRKGLGKFLIQILQLVANSTQMKKVMLTVFKHNHGAYQFFREALQFEIDDSSPSMSGCCGDDCSYEILSRRTKFGDSQHAHSGGHCGGCCH